MAFLSLSGKDSRFMVLTLSLVIVSLDTYMSSDTGGFGMSNKKKEPVHPFMDVLMDESDRGCILVAQAFLENQLENLLRKHLVKVSNETEKFINKLIGSGTSTPLGSFAPRARMARALGLINTKTYSVLMAINDLRRKYAHCPQHVTLKLNEITTMYDELEGMRKAWANCLNKWEPTRKNMEKRKHSEARMMFESLVVSLIDLQSD
jgi:DNA-binding MltR family transcriptional regulator